jgi:hypothetical protein
MAKIRKSLTVVSSFSGLGLRAVKVMGDNTFGTTTVRDCVAATTANILNMAFILVAQGNMENAVDSSTLWLRGAIWGAFIIFSFGFYVFTDSVILRSPLKLSRAMLSVVLQFVIPSLIALVPIGKDSSPGLVIIVVGTGMLMHGPLLLMAAVSGANLKAIAFFLVAATLNFNIIIFNGIGACIWYPLLAEQNPVSAGLLFSIAVGVAEGIAIKTLGLILSKLFTDVPGCTIIASHMVMHYHSYTESFRLTAIVYGAIQQPSGIGWVYALMFAFIINLFARSAWHSYILHQLFGLEFIFRPKCIDILHRSCRFSCGYFRFAGILGLILARSILLGPGRISEWWFNETVLVALIACLGEEMLEDCAMYCIEGMQYAAPWAQYSRGFYESCPDGHLFKVYEYSGASPKVAYAQEKFHVLVVSFVGACAAFFAIAGLVPLVSIQFLLGECDTAAFRVPGGGTLAWTTAGGCS